MRIGSYDQGRGEVMMTRPFAVIALSLVAACASSPNKELKSARDDRAAHFVDNVRAQRNLAEKQKAEDAMLAYKHATERRDARSSTMGMLLADNERVHDAASAVVTERRAFDVEVANHMSRIDARAERLRVETSRSNERVAPLWRAFDGSHAKATARIDALWTHSNDAFPDAKADVTARLDALDSTLDAIRAKVER
jgi:hypothetical protein